MPKDTKQVLADYKDVPNDLIKAIVLANETRIQHVADSIISKNPTTVGVYRLAMKKDSDNARQSSMLSVIEILLKNKIDVLVYEPNLDLSHNDIKFRKAMSLDELKSKSDIVIANRITEEISDIKEKLYTRDVFSRD